MRAYVDTNILVDLVLSRQEFLPDAQRVFAIGYAGEAQLANQGDRSLIFFEPKHGCGSPPRCHIHFIDWVGQGTLYSLDLPQTDKNLRAARADPNSFEVCRVAREIQQMLNIGYPWIFGELVVSLAG